MKAHTIDTDQSEQAALALKRLETRARTIVGDRLGQSTQDMMKRWKQERRVTDQMWARQVTI